MGLGRVVRRGSFAFDVECGPAARREKVAAVRCEVRLEEICMCPEPPGASPLAADEALSVTGVAQRQAWLAGSWPPMEQVRSGVWSVPVPIPDNPIRYTLSYVLLGVDEVVAVDPGWDTADGWAALVEGLTAAGSSVESVTGIVVTHIHADHHGLTGRLAAVSGAWVAMHAEEQATLPRNSQVQGVVSSDDEQWLTEQGCRRRCVSRCSCPSSRSSG